MTKLKGGFTLPGEAGYEELTLKMAKKWGADAIRDSDGTQLSGEILGSGYEIYSTICIIRDHNEWARKNMDTLQQTFLVTHPHVSTRNNLRIHLMEDFFDEQFLVNDTDRSMDYWQVYDRTTDTLVPRNKWKYIKKEQSVVLESITAFHSYTVSFLAFRIWEEISMYNHITNNWNKEHLMQIDPRYPKVREFMKNWLEEWCLKHPHTTVVRFTSLFYNFVWIWGSSEKNRTLFTDWGSYDFTVSALALKEFEEKYGYALTAEDFINQGKLQVTHMPPTRHKLDWMDFINKFTIGFARELVDIVHKHNKKAYVFYDDSWIGLEPYGKRFKESGFDGLIKCVFSGYEARMCAAVDVPVHELRLHPYLFPVGLGGAPTFTKGGDPTMDAKEYWVHVRRALLRSKIQRIGLGGYLHLVEDFPDFQDYIAKISDEFRSLIDFHQSGHPYVLNIRVAVLHCWGKLRSWTLSGHFHETYMHDLIHINEALAGLPLMVDFIDFHDVRSGALKNYDVVINAGRANSAWSGGDAWKDEKVITNLSRFVYEGGTFIGIHEPSAVAGYENYFRMAEVLGVDKDTGERVCHGKWQFEVKTLPGILPDGWTIPLRDGIFLTDGKAAVIASHDNVPDISLHAFGNGFGIYLGGFSYSPVNARMLLNLIIWAYDKSHHPVNDDKTLYLTDNANTECAYFPGAKILVVINNTDREQKTSVNTEKGIYKCSIGPYDQVVTKL